MDRVWNGSGPASDGACLSWLAQVGTGYHPAALQQQPTQRAMASSMSKAKPPAPPAAFTPAERDYIRRELDMFFSTLPSVAEGFQLKTWRGGPQAGRPKVPQAAAGLLERGLMRLDATARWPRLFFTDAGLAALRAMMADRRFADPAKFAHVRQELGLDPRPEHAEEL